MSRQGWADVALGAGLLTAWFAAGLRWLPVSWPVLVPYHVLGLTLSAMVAVRTLRDPLDVWKRLYPVALFPLAVIMFMPWVTGGVPDPLPHPLLCFMAIGLLLLTANAAYLLLWVPAWVVLRRRKATETPIDVPVVERRGVQA